MFKFKKLLAVGAVVLTVAALSGTALAAAAYSSPAEAAADLSGKTLESVIEERQEGKTYGEIAEEAGVHDEFTAAMLEMKKEILDERVAAGIITQEEADEIMAAMEEHIAACDGTGTGSMMMGLLYGVGFGSNGSGLGYGMGGGSHSQYGNGMGLQDGTCGYYAE